MFVLQIFLEFLSLWKGSQYLFQCRLEHHYFSFLRWKVIEVSLHAWCCWSAGNQGSFLNQDSRSRLSPSLTAKIDQNKAQRSPYAILWLATCDFFDFLDFPQKYLANATFRTSLVFQMSVLERLEKLNFIKNQRFGPKLKIRHPVEI